MEHNGKPLRVAVYCRVPSDEQAQAGTIENQLDFARRYCDLHGLLIHDFYDG
ncbi:MAG: recombinase family protein [Chloroflexi bacterium]|nr:recombinase family protein [Chloroflexota bacterium]